VAEVERGLIVERVKAGAPQCEIQGKAAG
jgi:hypothetical protein